MPDKDTEEAPVKNAYDCAREASPAHGLHSEAVEPEPEKAKRAAPGKLETRPAG